MTNLLLGIGIDSAFLLLHEWLLSIESGKMSSASELMVATIEGCFMSVTLSDFSAIAAFAVGCVTSFTAVKLCCAYLALCIAFLWLTELFFFVPCLAIKSKILVRRQIVMNEETESYEDESNRLEVCENLEEEDQMKEENSGQITNKSLMEGPAFTRGQLFNHYERLLMKVAIWITSKPILKLFWVLVFAILTLFSIYNVSKMEAFEDKTKYLVDYSYSKHYFEALTNFLPIQERTSDVIIKTTNSLSDWTPLAANHDFVSQIVLLQLDINKARFLYNITWIDCFLSEAAKFLNQSGAGQSKNWNNYFYFNQNLTTNCREQVFYDAQNVEIQTENETMTVTVIRSVKCLVTRRVVNYGDTKREKEILEEVTWIEDRHKSLNLMFYDYNIGVMWRDVNIESNLWMSVSLAGNKIPFFIPIVTHRS